MKEVKVPHYMFRHFVPNRMWEKYLYMFSKPMFNSIKPHRFVRV